MSTRTDTAEEALAAWADGLLCPVGHAVDEGCDSVVFHGLDAD